MRVGDKVHCDRCQKLIVGESFLHVNLFTGGYEQLCGVCDGEVGL